MVRYLLVTRLKAETRIASHRGSPILGELGLKKPSGKLMVWSYCGEVLTLRDVSKANEKPI